MAGEVLKDLQVCYQPLVGMTFLATYKGVSTMPFTEKKRDVFVIRQGNSAFHATLTGILSAVLKKYGETVWKGITGPEDSKEGFMYTDYWLWAEPDFSGQLQVGLPDEYNFQIAKCTPFTCDSDKFSHGVSIEVHKLFPE